MSSSSEPRASAWRLPYRSADFAATYDRLAVPHQFAGPARDLVMMLDIAEGSRVLDVGAGTGAATLPAENVVGPAGTVVALDPALEMLAVLRAKCRARLAAGELPGLPFEAGSFDAVVASFVLSHAKSCELAVADMVRVLKPGGRLGVSSWTPNQTAAALVWRAIVTQFVSEATFAQGYRSLVPWEERLSDLTRLRQVLVEGELQDVEAAMHAYPVSMSVADFLAMREASVEGRVLAGQLDSQRQAELKRELAAAFNRRYKVRVEYVREACLARGTKPAA